MLFSDLALSRRLESAEGHACAQFAAARRRLFPDSGAEWMECAGAYAIFDGIGSPITQSFGLGLFEPVSAASLTVIERFFLERGASPQHEMSPLAGVPATELLCTRNYRPIEISSVVFRPIEKLDAWDNGSARVRVIERGEEELWSEISVRGWKDEHPEFEDFLVQSGAIYTARKGSACFLAEIDGEPGATGALCIHEGVALLSGSSTIPELRRQGLQAALLEARLRYASEHGCDLAMMVAEAGSNSQRNAERKGFRIAYTRTKWQLF